MNNKDIFNNITKSCMDCDSVCYRENGVNDLINISDNIKIVNSDDSLDIIVSDNSKETLYMPVIVSENGLKDKAIINYNIGSNCEMTIYGSCIINNNGSGESSHRGIHNFYVESKSKIIYKEEHLGFGENINKFINSTNNITLNDDCLFKFNSIQLENVNNSDKEMVVYVGNNSVIDISESLKTSMDETVFSKFDINLDGYDSKCKLVSRSFADVNSIQQFISNVNGNNKCFAHVECDGIISGNAKIISIPGVSANHLDANLTHEASIGKINKEQVIKLMTLGYSKEEAKQKIIKGFLEHEM